MLLNILFYFLVIFVDTRGYLWILKKYADTPHNRYPHGYGYGYGVNIYLTGRLWGTTIRTLPIPLTLVTC